MKIPLTLSEAAHGLRDQSFSAVELLDCCRTQADRLDSTLGVYISRFDDEAHAAAKRADAELSEGSDRGPLHGLPIAIKDIIRTEEAGTTGNSTVVNDAWALKEDATVVARLRQAGAVITGKVTTMELALGVPDETKPFPYPRNPWDTLRWAGGSSSGSAAGVAAGMFLAAVGSDTGGSLRLPASYCGITAIKPTFGLVPKDGVIPLGSSQDVVGPLCRSAEDASLLLSVMAGFSPLDPTSARSDGVQYDHEFHRDVSTIRIGVDRTALYDEKCDPELRDAFDRAIDVLAGFTSEVCDVQMPLYEEVSAASMITWNSEAYTYHRRALREQWASFGFSVRTAFASGSVFTAADYIQAQKVRRLGRTRISRSLEAVDVIISPTVTGVAPEVEGLDLGKVFASVFTNYWSALGNPVMNLPIGFSRAGLPMGFQVAGRPFEESTLVAVGEQFQRATGWHLQVPDTCKGAFNER